MSKILKSSAIILVALAAVGGATYSFFSDTETSTGNTFTSGAIDLKIDSVSHYNGMVCTLVGQTYHWIPEANVTLDEDNQPVAGSNMDDATDWNAYNSAHPAQYPAAGVTCTGTWPLADTNGQPAIGKFFNFVDLKPGDGGENTISIHVDSNDAWMCASLGNVGGADLDATKTEPEVSSPDVTFGSTAADSELDENLYFFAWVDDGDNIYEPQQTSFVETSLGNPVPASTLVNGTWTLAAPGFNGGAPIAGGTTQYIGVQWCAGTLVVGPTGITCNGAGMGNVAQTDSWFADLSFYVEQARNNPNFVCPQAVQRQKVGAALGAYTQPTGDDCDVNVPAQFATIQGAINDAGTINGETVCVDAGTYNEDVVINKEIILAGDGATATSVINGQTGGQGAAVTIAANNVTLKGFEINGLGIAALWLNTGVSGATVQYNKVTSASGVTAVTTQGNQSNHLFANNEFVGTGSGQMVYVNGTASLGQASSNVDFDSNTFSGTIVSGGVALGNESTGSDITENKFASTLTSTYAIAETWEDDANINFNNFNGAGGIKVRNGDSGTVDAENNWWGAAVPAGHTAGLVDDNPKEVAAFPQN